MTQTVPTAPVGKIFVQIKARHIDKIVTESGIEFFQDTTYRPEWHVNLRGTVVSVPRRVGEQLENRGIVPEVKPGDEIYFDYSVCHNEDNEFFIEGQSYWMVDYFNVIGIRNQDGTIRPVGGKTLIEPYVEHREEKIGSIYLPDMSKKEQRKNIGHLIYIGVPRTGQQVPDFKAGDIVLFPEWAAAESEIDGKLYYIIDQDLIEATIDEV
jgi:co-chaperonin GroES (HSP10)